MYDADENSVEQILGIVGHKRGKLVTPDGVPLSIDIADVGERFAAFSIDFFFTLVVAATIEIVGSLTSGVFSKLTIAASIFVFFIVRNGYFVFFELRWAGATPGKRFMRLQVIDRRGGALTAGAIVARNLTREVEFFFPWMMLLGSKPWMRAPWEVVPVGIWISLMFLLPLCNPYRLRVGDLVAGTVVIALPEHSLLQDLVSETQSFHFPDEQLQFYWILELQVLEDILRRPYGAETETLRQEICGKIQRRILSAAKVSAADTDTFLRDFYTAQRAFLEKRKNLGEERLNKNFKIGSKIN